MLQQMYKDVCAQAVANMLNSSPKSTNVPGTSTVRLVEVPNKALSTTRSDSTADLSDVADWIMQNAQVHRQYTINPNGTLTLLKEKREVGLY